MCCSRARATRISTCGARATTAMAALLDPPRSVAAHLLAALRDDPDAATRRLAALALGEIGAAHPAAVPADTAEQLAAASAGAEDPDLVRAAERALLRLREGRTQAKRAVSRRRTEIR